MDSFLSLVLNSQRVTLPEGVQLCGRIGAENWANLVKACMHLELHSFVADRHSLIEAKREDLKTLWDCLGNEGEWVVFHGHGKVLKEVTLEWDTEEEKKKEWGNLQAGIFLLAMIITNE